MSEEWTADDTSYRPGGLSYPDLAKVGEVGVWVGEPAQTPVAQVQVAEDYYPHVVWMEGINAVCFDQQYLYVTPPQREWKGLTTAERKALWNVTKKPSEFAEMVEAKLKEKNEWTCKN